jgi:histidinol dehydrogenase
MVKNPTAIFEQIQNAGSVFLGALNPVALGDYATGINHVLPTMGWAKRSSAVGVWTYMKRVQYSNVNKKGFKELAPIVDAIAPIEGLIAHKKSVNFREEFE